MKIIKQPSPNFNSRENHAIDMLVLHYTGMRSGAAAIDRLCDATAKVSAHYVVEEDGRVFGLVEETDRAWHAGVSYWRGATNINQRSIGIEIVNPGHEYGYRAFPKAQMESVAELCKDILSRHNIPVRNVVGHSDVAPSRKTDPGELFDWKWLAEQGVGILPPSSPEGEGRGEGLSPQAQTSQLIAPSPHPNPLPQGERELREFGYDTSDLPATITAFQRRFRQNNLNGQWDSECAHLLHSLLAAIG